MSISAWQTTISKKIEFRGKGLHSGRIVTMSIIPAVQDTGIVFHRTDIPEAKPVKAHTQNISSTALSTCVGQGDSMVSTIEHIMAAFVGVGISNAIVRLDAPEVPIMDGSAQPFVERLNEVGVSYLQAPQKVLKVTRPFEVRNGDQFIRVEPSMVTKFECSIDFPFKSIGQQRASLSLGTESFSCVSQARTFCHIRDVNIMKERGLALGGSLDNAIVVDDEDIINDEGLRSQKEFAEHKLLDLIGDLALIGLPIVGKVTAHKPGHALHAEFTSAFLEDKCWIATYSSVNHHPVASTDGYIIPPIQHSFG